MDNETRTALAQNATMRAIDNALLAEAEACKPAKPATRKPAAGPYMVASVQRPECHAPSGYAVTDYSGSNGARDRMRDMILGFWQSIGWAYVQTGGAGGGARWVVKDVLGSGEWMPLASAGETDRADRAEFSHIIASAHGGAWCACNLIPEVGARNAARGDANIAASEIPHEIRASLATWGAYWRETHARKASLARLSA